jgi:hypothetical protein
LLLSSDITRYSFQVILVELLVLWTHRLGVWE